jgi:hypothetical protein
MNGKTARFIRKIAWWATYVGQVPERRTRGWKRVWANANAKERAHLRRSLAHDRGVSRK